jgi:transposase-like protein
MPKMNGFELLEQLPAINFHLIFTTSYDQYALKAVYRAITNIEKKWSMPVQNWGYILHQFLTIFKTRCQL